MADRCYMDDHWRRSTDMDMDSNCLSMSSRDMDSDCLSKRDMDSGCFSKRWDSGLDVSLQDSEFHNTGASYTSSGVSCVTSGRASYSGPLNTIHESTDSALGSMVTGSDSAPLPRTPSVGQLSDKMLPLKKRKLHVQQDLVMPQLSRQGGMQDVNKTSLFRSLPVDLTTHTRAATSVSPTPPALGGMGERVAQTVTDPSRLYLPASPIPTQVTHTHSNMDTRDIYDLSQNMAALNTHQLTLLPGQYQEHLRVESPMAVSPGGSPSDQLVTPDERPMPRLISIQDQMGMVQQIALPPGYPVPYGHQLTIPPHHHHRSHHQIHEHLNVQPRIPGQVKPDGNGHRSLTVIQPAPAPSKRTDTRTGQKHRRDKPIDAPRDRTRHNNHGDVKGSKSSVTDAECRMVAEADEDGDLPLHIAVVQNERPAINRLLHIMKVAGVDIDSSNHIKQTPLHLAAITKEPVTMEILLRAGASPNNPDRKGQTCCHLAVNYNSLSCLSTIFQHSRVKTDVDAKNYEGQTALHRAVQLGHVECAEMLLKYGAHIDMMDGKSGKTPLYLAFECNQAPSADMLIQRGADVNIPTYSGSTVLQAANSKGQSLLSRIIEGAAASHSNSSVRELQNKLAAKVNRNRSRTNNNSAPLSGTKRSLPLPAGHTSPLSTNNQYNLQYDTI